MRLLNGAAFDGPSLYAAFPAVWLRIQREAQDRPGPLGASALAPALEHLRRQGAAHTGVVARFIDHLAPAATALSPLALVGELALELQRSTGAAVTKSVIAETAVTGTADLAFAFEYGDVGLLAGRLAVALVSLATAPNVAAGAALDRLWSEFTSLAV